MALRYQIIEAIEEDCLQPFRDSFAGMITCSMPNIFNFLRYPYRQLSPVELE